MTPTAMISHDDIKREFLAAGFTIKPGHDDLKPYVYEAARRLLALAAAESEKMVAAERERCARLCDGIAAGYTGAARRLDGQHATHAAGQRDGANECAAAIRRA